MKNKSIKIHDEETDKTFFPYAQLLDALSPIMVTDRNDRLVYQNKKFTDIVGDDYSSVHKSMKEIVKREDWGRWKENLVKLFSATDNNGSVFNIRVEAGTAGIKYLKLKGNIFQRDDNQKPLLCFFSIEDVTGQFKDASTFLKKNDPEIFWQNFTAKSSAEKKLEFAIRDLDRSNKDLEEFAYVASHDLQEPLRKITSLSSLLAARCSEQLKDDGKLYIEKINTAALNMKTLIENLLQLARTVNQPQAFIPTDLNEILNGVKQSLDARIEEGRVQIIQDKLPVIDALPLPMMQLFNNLLSNAIKFSPENRTAVIYITSSIISPAENEESRLPADKTWYKIMVRDNGIGFKQEYAADIFKTFFRLNDKTSYPGTGIGLSICNKIVEKHNGLIWAESEPSKGASFFIVLPKTQDDNDSK